MPAPVVINGLPHTPAHRADCPARVTGRVSGSGIRSAPKPGQARVGTGSPHPAGLWTVADLPDPTTYPFGFYHLGARTSADGSSGPLYAGTPNSWVPNALSPYAPAWHSVYPFKPTVSRLVRYLPGGGRVVHPAAVTFHSHFIQHMWLDWGVDQPQPFTWLVTAMVNDWPTAGYEHYLLDAGKAPAAAYTPAMCNTPRVLAEGLGYRTALAVKAREVAATAGGGVVRALEAVPLTPRVFVGVFDGSLSYVGMVGVHRAMFRAGPTQNTGANTHRNLVMGRRQGILSQQAASDMAVLDLRVWRAALTPDRVRAECRYLFAQYEFGRYQT
jgi:hypothetical protein